MIDSEQAETLALRGTLLRKIGDLEGALADYTKAHQLIPSCPVLSYEIGLVLLQLGRLTEAESLLQVAVRKLMANCTLDLLHATCAYAIGNKENATESLTKYLSEIPTAPKPSAIYLTWLLQIDFNKGKLRVESGTDSAKNMRMNTLSDPIIQYFNATADRKAVLDWAGIANSPEKARQQICVAAFWMAQWEKIQGDTTKGKELLKIAIDAGSPDLTEWQLANWQWQEGD